MPQQLFGAACPLAGQFSVARLVLDQRVIDQVILLFMKAPFSSTGEDVCEIHCHGSRAVIDVLLARLGTEGWLLQWRSRANLPAAAL